ncbi:MAG TPA: multifunctional oxoglutarate decarboxylase/oxoglutarate dehydrogenase thiamine pyrophosphate-binding subunit/dihydrolipoyllysine-residue succinyltransferase subunit, partial [Acidimicrobiales bacterium]
SPVDQLTSGAFKPVLADTAIEPAQARRIVLASGKVAYDAIGARDGRSLPVPVVRIEQLYPWPERIIDEVLSRYEHATEVVWLQEEPENMGAWPFVHDRLHRLLRDRFELRHVSRARSASPATGSQTVHLHEQQELLDRALDI